MPWTFYVIAIIVCALVAVGITQMIYAPIKKRREDRRWQQSKEYWRTNRI